MHLVIYLTRHRQGREDAKGKVSQMRNLKADKVSRGEALHVGLFFKPSPWALSPGHCRTRS